jgi:hypothetical protein
MKSKQILKCWLATFLLLGASATGCKSEDEPEKESPRDPCEFEDFGCGDPLLHYYLDPELPDGQYRVTVETPEGNESCTLTRAGENEVGTPIIEVECEDDNFEDTADFNSIGLSFYNWLPETISLRIEDTESGCSISLTDEPVYEASYSECGDITCIEAWSRWTITDLHSCLSGMGGAGGMSGE